MPVISSVNSHGIAASDLISRAEACDAFHRFNQEFDSWQIQCWLGSKEKALHFGIGAFNPTGQSVLEVGTLEGASALYTMAGLRYRGQGRLYSIDPHLGAPPFLGSAPWQFTLGKFRANVERAGLQDYVRSIVSDSQIAGAIWPAISLDSVLIDGDHSYEGCLRDIECWATKLKVGGFLLIDDAEDPALPELLRLIDELKGVPGLRFEDLIEGIAVFRRDSSDAFALLDALKSLPGSGRRPWDMEFVQCLVPKPAYRADRLNTSIELLTAYQLGFLARCEPGDYAVSANSPASDVAVVDALIEARRDGTKVLIRPSAMPADARFRMAVCTVEEAKLFAPLLLPGGVMIARSSRPVTYRRLDQGASILA